MILQKNALILEKYHSFDHITTLREIFRCAPFYRLSLPLSGRIPYRSYLQFDITTRAIAMLVNEPNTKSLSILIEKEIGLR